MKFSSLLISILCISSCCYGWKIETEPFEKIPMYSTQDLSFKLQIEEGIFFIRLNNPRILKEAIIGL